MKIKLVLMMMLMSIAGALNSFAACNSASMTNLTISFAEGTMNKYGFDKSPSTNGKSYVSLEKEYKETQVKVSLNSLPLNCDLWVTSSNTNVFKLKGATNGGLKVTSKDMNVTLIGACTFANAVQAELQLRQGDAKGTVLKSLDVKVYKKNKVPLVKVYKCYDSNSTNSSPVNLTETGSSLKKYFNEVSKQAVVEFSQVEIGFSAKNYSYDENSNGDLDIYYDTSDGSYNPEVNILKKGVKYLSGDTKVVVVKEANFCWRCVRKVSDTQIELKGVYGLESLKGTLGEGKCVIGDDSLKQLSIKAINGNIVTFTSDIEQKDIKGKNLVVESGGGMSYRKEKFVVMDLNGTLKSKMLHELLHQYHIGALSDLEPAKNIMSYTESIRGDRLLFRYLKIKNLNRQESQWTAIPRTGY